MPKRTRDYRSWRLEKLTDPEIAEGYLNAALEDSPQMFLKALLNVTQARQVAVVAHKAGVKRETIYKGFSQRGNPTLNTLNSVLKVLGLQIKVAARGTASPVFTPATLRSGGSHYGGRKRIRNRRSDVLEAIGQASIPFGELTNAQGTPAPQVGHLLAEMPRVGYVGTGNFGIRELQAPLAALQIHSLVMNQEQQEKILAVPTDLLVATSIGAMTSLPTL